MRTLVFPAGRAIQFTTGEYSDFGNSGAVVTLKTCDLPAPAQQFAVEDVDEFGDISLSAFASWLVKNGHCFPADIEEVHLGEYGCFDSEFGVETKE